MIPLPPKVSPGDPFTAKLWNQLRDCVASLRPKSGANTRITQNPGGFIVNFDPPALNWNHPFRILISGNSFSVNVGTVNQVEPTIGGIPISGTDSKGKPIVGGVPKLSVPSDFDSESRAWVALKIVIRPDGSITSAQIVTTSTWPQVSDPYTGWHPIAMFKKISGTATPYQQTYHNLGHQWMKPSSGLGRHFFWAS